MPVRPSSESAVRADDLLRLIQEVTCWAHVPMLESRLANQKVPKRRVASRTERSPKCLEHGQTS